MINLFKLLKKHSDNLGKDVSEKKYWETSNIQFDTVIGPDGNLHNEREIFESIKKSDIDRLKKFS